MRTPGSSPATRPPDRIHPGKGFTIVELLVVIGILALLLGLLMPVLNSARKRSRSVQCQSNLRQLGVMLTIYQNDNDGWLFPVGIREDTGEVYSSFGINRPPHERWPMKVFKIPSAPNPPPYNSDDYVQANFQPDIYNAEPYTPKVLLCPEDFEPYEAHSYVLNSHLADHNIKAGKKDFGGLTVSDVILAGEKRTFERDYYMQYSDFARVVELYRHGTTRGSNYLYLDGHVGTMLPREALTGVDPWDLRARQ